ncbi:MAG: hypothetical protein JXR68_13415 [Bacteroidales bacterium]|nr:hypothetical protein [Bacteroidales bacterium]
MFKTITIKTKFYLFLVAIVLSVFFLYSFAIKNTINLFVENNNQEGLLLTAKNGVTEMEETMKKLHALNVQIGIQNNTQDVHQEILNTCSNYCDKNNLLVRAYPDKEIITIGQSNVEINKIIVEGLFKKSLQMLHMCEKDRRLGRVVSVKFEKYKDIYAKKERLLTSVYLQHIVTE